MQLTTVAYGMLIAVGLLAVVWFAFVLPSERRDHQRRLDIVRKRLAERAERAAEDLDHERERPDDGR